MNEPVYDDPKTQKWIELYQKRAKSLGQLPDPDVLEKTGLPANHWFWKEDNAVPSEAFAVNIELPVAALHTAESPSDLRLVATDDFGRRVRKLPIGKTSKGIWFGTEEGIFDSGIAAAKAPVEEFVWAGIMIMRELDRKRHNPASQVLGQDPEEEEEVDFMELQLRRISWMKGMNAWLFVLSEVE
jgi:hypothetical protein